VYVCVCVCVSVSVCVCVRAHTRVCVRTRVCVFARVMRLTKRLELFSACILVVLTLSQSVGGLLVLSENVDFLAKVAGIHVWFARTTLIVVSLGELVSVSFLCLPTTYNAPFAVAWICIFLAFCLAFEAVLAAISGDGTEKTKLLVMILVVLKNALVAMELKTVRGISIQSNVGMDLIKKFATKTRASVVSVVAIFVIMVHTAVTQENPFSTSPISRTLGRAAYTHTLAFFCLLASVGAEDRRERYTPGKYF